MAGLLQWFPPEVDTAWQVLQLLLKWRRRQVGCGKAQVAAAAPESGGDVPRQLQRRSRERVPRRHLRQDQGGSHVSQAN